MNSLPIAMTEPDEAWVNPDHQPPLPLAAAQTYARTVMTWARASLPDSLDIHADLAYGPDRLQRFDVYAPAQAHQAPVLIFWHGGGWTHGYREYVRFMAPHVVRLGIVLVAPSYRLAPAHRLPAAYEDALALLGHVHSHARDWGGDPERLLLSGHSAGGHLATLLSLREADRVKAGVPAGAVRACLPISGIMDLQHPAPPPDSLEERVYTMVLSEPCQDALMSPLCWASRQSVPYVLTLGTQDSERVRRSNQRLRALLEAHGTPVVLRELPATDHFGSHTCLYQAADPWWQELARLA